MLRLAKGYWLGSIGAVSFGLIALVFCVDAEPTKAATYETFEILTASQPSIGQTSTSGTFFLQGDIPQPTLIAISAIFSGAGLTPFDPSNLSTQSTWQFVAEVTVIDQNGSVVPERINEVGSALVGTGTNCDIFNCVNLRNFPFGEIEISDTARIIDVNATLTVTGNATSSLEIDLQIPDTLSLATPLPTTLPLFAAGLGFVGYLTRRKSKQPSLAYN